ncbi:hypothetical protein [Chryseobacterium pennipullorum]|uniref:Uncharacterized protein n=1 Tax=Chryseobacterium pennipullorum TaxID=2258963 RepID=A0A3D9AQ62_9FLAO|nr:hypothetical protein [Chryseobacterium pennipullorum]REC43444.1 hypothetical protein DRF67_18940 [Chryseobacterium pennipullorum]
MNTVDTILELRSLVGTSGDSVTLLGYYEKGDKHPITYYFKSGNFIDDGGSVIVLSNASSAGAWVTTFSDTVFIEHFGVSETNPNNSQSMLNAIKLNKKLISIESKRYLIDSTIIVTTDIDLSLGKDTVFYSLPITASGLEARSIFKIGNTKFVSLKGIFDGGYILNGVVQGLPRAAGSSSALIQITDCTEVMLTIQIQNFASNWGAATFEALLNYGAIYVRKCTNVKCLSSSLTTSRIEGFVFLENDNVTVDGFKSVNNIGIWTPLHCFCNNRVEVMNCSINQPIDTKGSTINSYNNFTSFDNNFIEGGVGIDFSWELLMDTTPFNITPVKIIIKNNIIKNCDSILTAIRYSYEKKKLYVGVFQNYFENTGRAINKLVGVIRVDACEKLDICFNIAKTSFGFHGFFQSIGNLDYVNISSNLVSSDFFIRLTQIIDNKYGIVNINNNIFNALPLNGRNDSSANSFSSFAYVSTNQPADTLIFNKNSITAEGRVFWFVGGETINKIQVMENVIKSPHKISYLISNVNEIIMHKNSSFNCDIFSVIANLNNSTLDIRENNEFSDITKSKGMFNSISGSVKTFTFIKNKFNVPNPNTFGIINNVNSVTNVVEKDVRDNIPEVSQTKILFSSTKYGNTLNRPTNKVLAYDGYYDTDINKYIIWDGTNWRDSLGNVV